MAKTGEESHILRMNNGELWRLLDSLTNGVWEVDLTQSRIRLSDRLCNSLGYTAEELGDDPRTLQNLVHPDDRADMLQLWNESVEDATQDYCSEFRIRTKEGTWRWIRSRGKVTERDSIGLPIRMAGMHEDITDQKQSEENLRQQWEQLEDLIRRRTGEIRHTNIKLMQEIKDRKTFEERLSISEERLLLATRAARVGVWDWNPLTDEFFLDATLKNLLGYTNEEFPNDRNVWLEQIHSDDREIADLALQNHLEGKTTEYVIEYRMKHKDGSLRWFLVNAQAMRDHQKNVVRLIGTHTDITERKRFEEALQQSEFTLRQVLDLVPHHIYAKDQQGTFLLANKAVARSFDMTPEELVGKNHEMIAPNVSEVRQALLDDRQIIESGQAKFTAEEPFTDIHGQLHWLSTIKVPYTHRNTPAVLVCAVDITDRRHAQEELLRTNVELQEEIAERRQIERQLREKEHTLRALHVELSRLEETYRRQLAEALHDGMAQNLYAIMTKVRVLESAGLNATDQAILMGILELADRAMQDTRHLTLDLCPPVLYESGLAAALEWLVQRSEESYHVPCHLRIDASVKSLQIDEDVRGLMYYGVRELIANCVKHAQAKGISITMAKRDGSLQIKVRDDGVGFNLSEKDPAAGSGGFGLFSIRERLHALGGHLDIQSEPGEGSCVTLNVPLHAE